MTPDESDDDRLLGDTKLFPVLLIVVALVVLLPLAVLIAVVMH